MEPGGRGGGYDGGGPGESGDGPAGGAPGHDGDGAGGGGNGSDGEAGYGAAGGPEAGGAGGEGDGGLYATCVDDFLNDACGGSGGGGAAGPGGAGAGTVLLVSLSPLDVTGGAIAVRGAPGAEGGGGGAGGNVVVAAPTFVGELSIDIAGGGSSGAVGAGGEGADGRLRAEGFTSPLPGAVRGPSVQLAALDQLPSESSFTLTGAAQPAASVVVGFVDRADTVTTTASAEGTWSADLNLEPGLNRITVRARDGEAEVRSWAGTNIEFQMVTGEPLPIAVGGTVDVVLVPDSE